MTKQILVDVGSGLAGVSEITYITVRDDKKGLIKTINIKATHPQFQANEILKIAKQYDINKIKIDTKGFGIAVFDYITLVIGCDNCMREFGVIDLPEGSQKDDQTLITESYKDALNSLNEAIDSMRTIQEHNDYSSVEYRSALENQLVLEKAKLELIQNELKNKSVIFGSKLNSTN